MTIANPYIEIQQFGSGDLLAGQCFRPENSDKLKDLARCIPTLFLTDHKAARNILNSVITDVEGKSLRIIELTELVKVNVQRELKDRCNIENVFDISSKFTNFLLDAWASNAHRPVREFELQPMPSRG